MFNPYPKPQGKEKKIVTGQWVGGVFIQRFKKAVANKKRSDQRYRCSDGTAMTHSQIENRLKKEYGRQKHPSESKCECCGEKPAVERDHTISRRQCKLIRKTELIWDIDNWSLSDRGCHMEWESYKSGKFQYHKNFIKRMLFMKKHDRDGFNKRINYISNKKKSKLGIS